MTYEEMKVVQRTIADALERHAAVTHVEAQPFDPGELPEILMTVNGDDVFVTIAPI